MTDAADPGTLGFYSREAPDYAARGPDGTSRLLAGFLARLPAGGNVLELGCGAGRDAAAMIAAGFVVDATDGCPEMVAQAARRVGSAARLMRFDALQAEAAYNGVYAHASLLHIPRAGLPDVLARILRALRPGGWHVASFKAGGAEGRDEFGRLFNYPDAGLLAGLHRDAGFRVESVRIYQGGGYGGGRWPWLAVPTRR